VIIELPATSALSVLENKESSWNSKKQCYFPWKGTNFLQQNPTSLTDWPNSCNRMELPWQSDQIIATEISFPLQNTELDATGSNFNFRVTNETDPFPRSLQSPVFYATQNILTRSRELYVESYCELVASSWHFLPCFVRSFVISSASFFLVIPGVWILYADVSDPSVPSS
jgi:hypothetical protein